ncbi:ABC-three component system protein [Actinomadura fibrosa]|uniref:ABC-three component system protein n=1 Tax=Actinomadura fibrosa TaxID=111802 RepID=A0ABW2XQY5_9ACTN|nr:ABC-three component system protein [Actinomadura fibrosa]
MLRKLEADDPRFKTLEFRPGLNLVVADTTPSSATTDSRNGVGKSSLVELLHFLLGSRPSKHLATRRVLKDITFGLVVDWPNTTDGLSVRRKGANPTSVIIDPDISAKSGNRLDIGPGHITLAEWNSLIESGLFNLSGQHPGISGRALLSYYMRRIASNGFNEAIRVHSRQAEVEATTNLAYLLGLDWQLASKYKDIAAREATRKQLRQAVNDPVWGRIVGNTAELRGQITIAEARVARLEEQISSFRVVPEYEALKSRADQLTAQIRQLSNQDVIDRRNLEDLEAAVRETSDTEVRYLEPVYRELGVILNEHVRQRFEDVQNFHESIVRNRRRYLGEEIASIQNRLAERRQERERLGAEQSRILQELNEGGALEALTTLQRAYAQEQASLEALRNRLTAAQALEASARQIASMRLEVEEQMATDLEERAGRIREATLLFDQFAKKLYGEERSGYLAIEAGRNSVKITPRIDSDESRGIGNMVIFCFDLTVATIAHRHGRGPNFLVHDSHLFDGVDDRQLKAALELAAEVAEAEEIQYVATLNSDDLAKATNRGYDAKDRVLPVRLTDAYADGGLFGFRF